jgi:hypothetical protein
MKSPDKSPAAFSAHVATTPTELHFIDAGANINLEAHSSAFLHGTYTRLRIRIHVKGIDVGIHGYGIHSSSSTLSMKTATPVNFAFGLSTRLICPNDVP